MSERTPEIDEFRTVQGEGKAETRISASRFLAFAYPVADRAAVESHLARVRHDYFDATHHCYAFRLGAARTDFRAHDDGEPNGTAGKPILGAIDHAGLTDVLVVVVRYYGGTKLGTGGLARAYSGAATLALQQAPVVTRFATVSLRASFPHAMVGAVMRTISKVEARIVDTQYEEDVHLVIEVRKSRLEQLRAALVEQTSGNIALKDCVPPCTTPESGTAIDS